MLFGNTFPGAPVPDAWPAQNPAAYTVISSLVIDLRAARGEQVPQGCEPLGDRLRCGPMRVGHDRYD
ncbi:MAG: hypothetical protein ACR2GE_08000 [Pseudonocardia sp.]